MQNVELPVSRDAGDLTWLIEELAIERELANVRVAPILPVVIPARQ